MSPMHLKAKLKAVKLKLDIQLKHYLVMVNTSKLLKPITKMLSPIKKKSKMFIASKPKSVTIYNPME